MWGWLAWGWLAFCMSSWCWLAFSVRFTSSAVKALWRSSSRCKLSFQTCLNSLKSSFSRSWRSIMASFLPSALAALSNASILSLRSSSNFSDSLMPSAVSSGWCTRWRFDEDSTSGMASSRCCCSYTGRTLSMTLVAIWPTASIAACCHSCGDGTDGVTSRIGAPAPIGVSVLFGGALLALVFGAVASKRASRRSSNF